MKPLFSPCRVILALAFLASCSQPGPAVDVGPGDAPPDRVVTDVAPDAPDLAGDSPRDTVDTDACVPQCAGRDCGDDGCGGQCGACWGGEICLQGVCVTKGDTGYPCDDGEDCASGYCLDVPDPGEDVCTEECDPDGEPCPFGWVCVEVSWGVEEPVWLCAPPCTERSCADAGAACGAPWDGCFGMLDCGGCGTFETCDEAFACACTFNDCEGVCCGEGEDCVEGACVPPVLCDPPCPAGFSCVDGSCCSFKDATCDGVDDDCDGETDDDYVVIPSCGKGVCKDGSVPSSCVDGVETPCEPGPPDEDEDQTCDGLDGDCDGFKDEDYPVEADCGEGWCQDTAAPSSCAGGVESPCVPGAPAEGTDLSCDGVDGDCDGETDEDYEVVSACGKGWCLLAANPSSCEGGLETPCMPGTKAEATDVTCDGVDGDCDGATDEDYAPKLSCGKGWCQWSNQPSTCIGGVETPCLPGTPLGATDASCDGVDGDCDGVADDDYVSDETCGLGACRWTNTPSTCSGGVELPCKPGLPATSDGDCDLVDDDCNGEADEDADPPCDAGDPVLGLEVEILTEVGLPAGLAEELGDGSYLGRIVDLTDAGAGGDVHADAHGNPSAAVPLQVAPGPVNQVLLALHADEVHADGATVHALISATDAMGAGVDEDTEVRILALFDGESWWTDAQPAGDGIFSAGIEVPPQAFDGGGELLVQAVSGIHSSTVMTCQVVPSPAAPAPPAGRVLARLPLGPVHAGHDFDVPILVNTGGHVLGAYDISLDFDPGILQIVTVLEGSDAALGPPVSNASTTANLLGSLSFNGINVAPGGIGGSGPLVEVAVVRVHVLEDADEGPALLDGSVQELTSVTLADIRAAGPLLLWDAGGTGSDGTVEVLHRSLRGLFARLARPALLDTSDLDGLEASSTAGARVLYSDGTMDFMGAGGGLTCVSTVSGIVLEAGCVLTVAGTGVTWVQVSGGGLEDSVPLHVLGPVLPLEVEVRDPVLQYVTDLDAIQETTARAEAVFSDGEDLFFAMDVSARVQFGTDAPSLLTVSPGGVVSAAGPNGPAGVRALGHDGAVLGATSVTVAGGVPVAVTALEVLIPATVQIQGIDPSPAAATEGTAEVSVRVTNMFHADGQQAQAVARLILSDDAATDGGSRIDVTGQAGLTWSSGDGLVAGVDGDGTVTARATGEAAILASYESELLSIDGEGLAKVVLPPPVAVHLTVPDGRLARSLTDPAHTVLGLPVERQLQVVVVFADGTSQDFTARPETSFFAPGNQVQIDSTATCGGQPGCVPGRVRATGLGVGEVQVTVTFPGTYLAVVTDHLTVEVVSHLALGLELLEPYTPADEEPVPETSLDRLEGTTARQKARYRVTETFTDGSSVDLTEAAGTGIATYAVGTTVPLAGIVGVDLVGRRLTGLATGLVDVVAQSGPHKSPPVPLAVSNTAMDLMDLSLTYPAGGTLLGIKDLGTGQLRVVGTGADGTRCLLAGPDTVTGLLAYGSMNPGAATVDGTGLMTARGNGPAILQVDVAAAADIGAAFHPPAVRALAVNLLPAIGDVDMGEATGLAYPDRDPGEVFIVPVRVNTGPAALGGLDMAVTWDPLVLLALGVAPGAGVPGAVFNANIGTPGTALFNVSPPGGAAVSGAGIEVARITFQALKPVGGPAVTAMGGTVLGVLATDTVSTLGPPTPRAAVAAAGSLDPPPADVPGDANDDGFFNVGDVSFIQQVVVTPPLVVPNGTQLLQSDLYPDGDVAAGDAFFASQVLARLTHFVTVNAGPEPGSPQEAFVEVALRDREGLPVTASVRVFLDLAMEKNLETVSCSAPHQVSEAGIYTQAIHLGSGVWGTHLEGLEVGETIGAAVVVEVLDAGGAVLAAVAYMTTPELDPALAYEPVITFSVLGCLPSCAGKACGADDGCGAKCQGPCPGQSELCVLGVCQCGGFDCTGKLCGDPDGCGGLCPGACGGANEVCAEGACLCAGAACAGACCPAGWTCTGGACTPPVCQLQCAGKACGAADGCGGICQGNCPKPGDVCVLGACCTPSCTGKSCGQSDGCAALCDGPCPGPNQDCVDFQCECLHVECLEQCCDPGDVCLAGECVCPSYSCAGKACGAADGCGGKCFGPCPGQNQACVDGTCQCAGEACQGTCCADNETCASTGCCVFNCFGKACGADNGCEGLCQGPCAAQDRICVQGACECVHEECKGACCLPWEVCGPDGGCCAPLTCEEIPAQCGTPSDGCGGTLSCGTCPPNAACSGDYACECLHLECEGACCPAGQECLGGACCDYNCTGKTCGASDGCGGKCQGPCAGSNQVCLFGTCACAWTSCAGACCAQGQQCQAGQCCTPKSCFQLGAECGNPVDPCGKTLQCGGCGLDEVCGANFQCACEFEACGGGCCPEDHVCAGGQCLMICVPDCEDKYCGASDGCGGVCAGPCPGQNQVCSPGFQCVCAGLACGAACCGAGEQCISGQCCDPLTCLEAGANCGAPANGCGGSLSCGSCGPNAACGAGFQCACQHVQCLATCCAADQMCVGGQCKTVCQPACAGKSCGVSDGCGGICMGPCTGPNQVCKNGVCQCAFASCQGTCCAEGKLCVGGACCSPSCAGKACGASDGCGGTCKQGSCPSALETCVEGACKCSYLQCGGTCCGVGETCAGGACQPCQSWGCEDVLAECGAPDNGCGSALSCGTCPEGRVCDYTFSCACEHQACGNGCCDTGEACADGACVPCTPLASCAAAGAACGVVPDGCGGTLSCGTCPAGQSCGADFQCHCAFEACGSQCCLAGELCHAGACCTPSCLGKSCGDPDGCGGFCDGPCGDDQYCLAGLCLCEFDTCLGQCCAENQACIGGTCKACTKTTCAALGAGCGLFEDGCGGFLYCGACLATEYCSPARQCECLFTDCGGVCCPEGAACLPGGGGCACPGGLCGSQCCAEGEVCFNGQCCDALTCLGEGAECGWLDSGCGSQLFCGICGEHEQCGNDRLCQCAFEDCDGACCADGQACLDGECCEPQCAGKLCGAADGCGGLCQGPCAGDAEECVAGACECLYVECGGQCCDLLETCGNGQCKPCVPIGCAAGGYECGVQPDSCGGTVSCGTCPAGRHCSPAATCECDTVECGSVCCPQGQGCVGGACVPCVPKTCGQLGLQCGTAPDGCGGTLSCGSCGPDRWCTPQQTCACVGFACGAGCCDTGDVCVSGQCCTPWCNGKTCGQGDGCGGLCDGPCANPLHVCKDGACACEFGSCGGACCGEGEVCKSGQCCQPLTCQALGLECGVASNGCGGQLFCGGCPAGEFCSQAQQCACAFTSCQGECCLQGETCKPGGCSCPGPECNGACCAAGQVCTGGGCCTPTTCQAAGAQCGQIASGCGGFLSCGTCPAGKTCGPGNTCVCAHESCGAACCLAGQSCVNGACCAPQCAGKACGASDGCGGLCQGSCTDPLKTCVLGTCDCIFTECASGCCQQGQVCSGAACCTPQCTGKACGAADGCGGKCQGPCSQPDSACVQGTCSCLYLPCGASCCGLGEECDAGACTDCQPATCGELSAQCGTPPDGCGGFLSCGTCPAGRTCTQGLQCACIGLPCGTGCCAPGLKCEAGACVACTPATCEALGVQCGEVPDGCGQTLDCGGCGSFGVCNEATHLCTCQGPYCGDTCCAAAATCHLGACCTPSCTGKACGASDGCGGVCQGTCPGQNQVCSQGACGCKYTACGTACCAQGEACIGGTCTACDPQTCLELGASCGLHADGCGGALFCGACPVLASCNPETDDCECLHKACSGICCAANEGCNLQGQCQCPVACASGCCAAGDRCVAGSCCKPKTCGELGKTCGGHLDGCGGVVQCGDCPEGSDCLAGVCQCDGAWCAGACCASGEYCIQGQCQACTPNCGGKACGAQDGCGGVCAFGSCPVDQYCNIDFCDCAHVNCEGACCGPGEVCLSGQCTECTPSCAGKACGASDGCGGKCQQGPCQGPNQACVGGACTCTWDGCGAACCGQAEVCEAGQCVPCQPSTCQSLGASCGSPSNGCGAFLSCGACPPNQLCNPAYDCDCLFAACGAACCAQGQACYGGACCTPQCAGKACGAADGCGGLCDGSCAGPHQVCEDGACVCAFETCGATCCAEGHPCVSGSCCTPQCAGKSCGAPDGCGGLCDGPCIDPLRTCEEGACVCAFTACGAACCAAGKVCHQGACCTPQCTGKACGASDGCGGLCNGPCTGENEECFLGVCICAGDSCAGECCAEDEPCVGGSCCAPLTCLEEGADCGPLPDGCGSLVDCGLCGEDAHCTLANECVCDGPPCGGGCCPWGAACVAGACTCPTPWCDGICCGGDEECIDGVCVGPCTPSCVGKACGDSDGCGGLCEGPCADPEESCQDFLCSCQGLACFGDCCPGGDICFNLSCCTRETCASLGAECGFWSDGCGSTLSCGSCGANATCTLGACQCQHAKCGSACCPAGDICLDGHCSSCTPDCTGASCGASDGCGGICTEGTCPPGRVCEQGVCACQFEPCGSLCCAGGQICANGACVGCTPSCAPGASCGAPDGCGGRCDGPCADPLKTCYSGTCICAHASCGGACCGEGQICDDGQCCTPETCGNLGAQCGAITDGCGATLDCGACPQNAHCTFGNTCVCDGAACAGGCCAYGQTCQAGVCHCASGPLCNGVCCAATQTCQAGVCTGPCVVQCQGKSCGDWNGCGGFCNGPCPGLDETCVAGSCVCAGITCNGTCCNPGDTCFLGFCCTPSTCQSLGAECGPAADGCGGSLSCGTCPPGKTCNPFRQCVQP